MTELLQRSATPYVETDRLAVDTLRFLAVDMVQAANSGHPGMPMGAAPMAWALWSRHLRHDPAAPDWADRDRFVLSAGHGSALLYGLLHIFGYDLPEDELRGFRQLGLAHARASRVRPHGRASSARRDRSDKGWAWRSGWRSRSGWRTRATRRSPTITRTRSSATAA